MGLQRIDENFDKLVNSVLSSIEPEFPKINKKELFEIATINFLEEWFKIEKERDEYSQKQKLKRFSEKIQSIKKILIQNGWMPDKKRKKK